MELVRRTIRMTRQKGKAVSQMTLDDDYNIPETMPDVGMIVQEKGDLEIGEVRGRKWPGADNCGNRVLCPLS